MSYRSRANPLTPGLIDLDTAKRAVAKVAQERDALAVQLQRARAHADTLQRQLSARSAESADLARALRVLEDQLPPAAERGLPPAVQEKLHHLDQQLESTHGRLRSCTDELEVMRAERDRLEAALRAANAEQSHPEPSDTGAARRLAADLANVRRHQGEAIERGVQAQTDRLLGEILSVRDSVRRALETLPGDGTAWHDGLLAVLARVDAVFEREGVHVVGAPGEQFDPRLHEAFGTVPGREGFVIETINSGLVRNTGASVVSAKVLVGGGT